MNHIKQLQLEIELLKSTLNEHRGDILDLERYLTSDKFHHDTIVLIYINQNGNVDRGVDGIINFSSSSSETGIHVNCRPLSPIPFNSIPLFWADA